MLFTIPYCLVVSLLSVDLRHFRLQKTESFIQVCDHLYVPVRNRNELNFLKFHEMIL